MHLTYENFHCAADDAANQHADNVDTIRTAVVTTELEPKSLGGFARNVEHVRARKRAQQLGDLGISESGKTSASTAATGAKAGAAAGPVGIVVGAVVGAIVGSLIAGKKAQALRNSQGATYVRDWQTNVQGKYAGRQQGMDLLRNVWLNWIMAAAVKSGNQNHAESQSADTVAHIRALAKQQYAQGVTDPEVIYSRYNGGVRPNDGDASMKQLFLDMIDAALAEIDASVPVMTPSAVKAEWDKLVAAELAKQTTTSSSTTASSTTASSTSTSSSVADLNDTMVAAMTAWAKNGMSVGDIVTSIVSSIKTAGVTPTDAQVATIRAKATEIVGDLVSAATVASALNTVTSSSTSTSSGDTGTTSSTTSTVTPASTTAATAGQSNSKLLLALGAAAVVFALARPKRK